MVAPFSKFYGKIWVGFFVLTLEIAFFRGFIYELGIFKLALRLRDRHVFMRKSVENLNVFNTLTLKQTFWKSKAFFRKLEYRFLVESTKIEKASFPFKTAISESNVKTNRMASTKWTYHKEQSFASNYSIFFESFCFSLRTSSKELIWCANDPDKCPYSYFLSELVFYLRMLYLCEYF